MVALVPTDQTPEQHYALLAMLPAYIQVQHARRGDVLAQLDRCSTEDGLIDSFDTALIEHGGTHIGPFLTSPPKSGSDNHQHEIDLLGIYGCGDTYPTAIANWRKAAQRMARFR